MIFIEPFIEDTTDFLEKNKGIGLLHCKLLNPDGTLQYSARRFYTYPTLLVRRFPLYRELLQKSYMNKRHLYQDKNFNSIFFPHWVLGSFMMIPRKVLNEVGFLDERFTLYFEDVDYCRRIWQKGYKVVYYPYKKVIHMYNRESDTRKFFEGFKFKKGAQIHLQSMFKYLKKYKFDLGK